MSIEAFKQVGEESDTGPTLVAAPKPRVFEEIVQFLTSEIEAGRLRPGDRLKPERELAVQLGVSRGSLREALKALEMLDVVELRHGLGIYITLPQPEVLSKIFGTLLSMQPSQAADIMDARIALECHAARVASRNASARDLTRIRRALDKMVHAAASGTGQDGADADHEFHTAIVESTGNATLIFLYSAITGLLKRGHHERWMSMFSREEYWAALNRAHSGIVDAIAARNPDSAAELMAQHFSLIERIVGDGDGRDK
jgi:GntR family transcriptional repressor for pyruvate dehydrogenase complex